VQTFGNADAADFAAGSKAAGHFARLAQTVRDLDVEEARQDGGAATAKEVLFDSLRLDLQGIARTARAIDAGEPGFADRFRSPAGVNQKALLTAADAFAREFADPAVATKFLACELPADQSAPVGRLRVGSEARRCSEARRRTDVRQCCARFWRREVAMRG
jgi:hypothetical protein